MRALLMPVLVVVVTTLIGVWLSAESRAQAPSSTAAIAGAWTLNRDLSDKPQMPSGEDRGERRSGRGGGGFGRGGYGRGGGMGRGGGENREDAQRLREAMRDLLTPPERLTIVQTESMVVITTGDGRVTRLSPDGKKIKDENTRIERRTRWEAGKLVSEVNGLGRGKVTETYSVDPERHQLVVAIAMENSRAPQPMTQRRVYDADTR